MRITVVNKYALPVEGGIERHVNDLVTVGSKDARVGRLNLLVANTARTTVEESLPKGRLLRVASLGRLMSAPLADFRAGIRELPADLFHFHFPNPTAEVAWLAQAARGSKLVVTYHSDIVRQRWALPVLGPAIQRFLGRADRILVTSPALLHTSPFLQPHAAKCRVVPLGIDTKRFAPEPGTGSQAEAFRHHWGDRVVLFVGRLVYYKGLDVLLEAAADLHGRLVIVGDGPMRQQLRAQIASLGLEHKVLMAGVLSDQEVAAAYRAADVFVLPSTHRSEAYGLVQLEAHASGLPVVSTDLPTGVPWVNKHGVTGLVVPPSDARALAQSLNQLLDDHQQREQLGRQARERALHDFSLEAMFEGIVSVYQELL